MNSTEIPEICRAFRAAIPYFEDSPTFDGASHGLSFDQWSAHFNDCDACGDQVLRYRLQKEGVIIDDYACVHMAYRATETCDQNEDRAECPDLVIAYEPCFDEYSIIKHDVSLTINYCPWCGTKLPPSQRNRWFEELERMGIDDPLFDGEQVPEAYRTSAWFKNSQA